MHNRRRHRPGHASFRGRSSLATTEALRVAAPTDTAQGILAWTCRSSGPAWGLSIGVELGGVLVANVRVRIQVVRPRPGPLMAVLRQAHACQPRHGADAADFDSDKA